MVFNSSTFAFLNSSSAASSILYPSADFKILSTKPGYNVNNSKISDLLNVDFSSLFFVITWRLIIDFSLDPYFIKAAKLNYWAVLELFFYSFHFNFFNSFLSPMRSK